MITTITKEITDEQSEERIPDLEEIIWRFELGRFDSHNPEYHLRNSDTEVKRMKEQYEASLIDPRRI